GTDFAIPPYPHPPAADGGPCQDPRPLRRPTARTLRSCCARRPGRRAAGGAVRPAPFLRGRVMPRTACPCCGRKLRVPDHLAGRRVSCPRCQEPLVIPAAPGLS